MLLIKWILRVLPILYAILIWLQSSYFNPESVHAFSDYIGYTMIVLIGICLELAHLVEFGILYFLIILAFLTWGDLTFKKEVIGIIAAVSYGVIDEIHQFFTLYRSFSIVDIIKNTLGVAVIWWIMHKLYFKDQNSKVGNILKNLPQK